MCYKPDMRKWMSDRFKRRKKSAEKQPVESAPVSAPLQPKYFEAETQIADSAPEPEAASLAAEPEERPEPAPIAEAPSELPASAEVSSADSIRRGRRRRRGRGGRTRSTVAAKPQPESAPAPTGAEAAAPPLAPVPAKTSTKGAVVLAVGLPGSGKSAWFKRNNITPLSSDMLRTLLFDDPTEQRFQDLIFSNLRSMLKARLIARRPVNYVDATNLTPHERHGWIKLAHDYGYEVQAVFFDVPAEVCMERNRRRERVVPEDVMQRMAAKLRPPTFEEGFTKITVVKVKKKDTEAAAG